MSGVIEHREGSVFEAPLDTVLAHSCNCKGKWGSGIAAVFKERFPLAYNFYADDCTLLGNKLLGKTRVYKVYPQGVACLFTSKDYGPRVDAPQAILSATESALIGLFKEPVVKGCKEIHSPRINAGLFKVPWESTEALIKKHLPDGFKWVVWTPKP